MIKRQQVAINCEWSLGQSFGQSSISSQLTSESITSQSANLAHQSNHQSHDIYRATAAAYMPWLNPGLGALASAAGCGAGGYMASRAVAAEGVADPGRYDPLKEGQLPRYCILKT